MGFCYVAAFEVLASEYVKYRYLSLPCGNIIQMVIHFIILVAAIKITSL